MGLPCGTFNQTYDEDQAIVRTRLQWGLLGISVVSLFLLPLVLGEKWLYVLNYTAITCIALLGLNLLTGYCGQISIAHTAFMAIGGYTSAILTGKVGIPFWFALPLAGVCAGILGVLFGLPALRIKGLYLALTTLAAQLIIIFVIWNWDSMTGGPFGIAVPSPSLGGFEFYGNQAMAYIILPVTLLMLFFAKNLVRTRVGRAWIAIRDNDIAAEVMGVSLLYYKLLAFFIACFFAGVAGSLFAHLMIGLHPNQFTLVNSIWYLGMLIIGGLGSTTGAVFGAIFYRGLEEIVDVMNEVLPGTIAFISEERILALSLVVFALVIGLFLVYEPRGVAHRWELLKHSYRIWPFPY